MIRVAFALQPHGTGWIGGNNYFRNLLQALISQPELLCPVALVGKLTDFPEDFPKVERHATRACRRRSELWTLRQIVRRATGRDWVMEGSLRRASVDVLSHSGWLGLKSKVPSIAWIPDFQHLHYPEFFSADELRVRNKTFAAAIERATLVVVSSEAALKDLKQFSAPGAEKARVLHFADSSACNVPATAGADLGIKFKLPERYFVLPNQFWVHKNHRIVIEALGRLKKAGKNLTVVSTGNSKDYRRPGHYESLVELVRELGLEENFRFLGIVSYEDLAGLMRQAIAVINPSLFEGWSTTVEEARTLGKRSLLSSIPVHLEQAPPRARFFEPHDAEDLSRQLLQISEEFSPEEETIWTDAAAKDVFSRKVAFARAFHLIADEATKR